MKITAKNILTAARAGKITAYVIDAEKITGLCNRDDSSSYPIATIGLAINGEQARSLTAWKSVYRCKGNDSMTGEQILPKGSWAERSCYQDGVTRGDIRVGTEYELGDEENEGQPLEIFFQMGEGMAEVDSLDVRGLTKEEAEEVREAVATAIDDAYDVWQPETPSDDELYQVITKHTSDVDVEMDVAGETVRVGVSGAMHLGQPLYAVHDDESETIYESAQDAVDAAQEQLAKMLREAATLVAEATTGPIAERLKQAVKE